MAKLNMDFVLLDESVMLFGFRALMRGAQLDNFKKNPVMLLMHARAESTPFKSVKEDTVMPIGKWYDIRVDNNQLLAKPDFDDDDDFAQRVEKKVRKGYLNGASIWIDPVAVSDDKALMLPGQKGPTITQWGLFEASIVDIPNCKNALAIRNGQGETVKLFSGTDQRVIQYLNTLVPHQIAPSQKVSRHLAAELVDGAIKSFKLTAGSRENYIKLAMADYLATREVIEGMPAFNCIEALLTAKGSSNDREVMELMKRSGRDLYMDGGLERLKALNMEGYKAKFKEYFGFDYVPK